MADGKVNYTTSITNNSRKNISLQKQTQQSQTQQTQSNTLENLNQNYQIDPYKYVNAIPLDEYIYDLRNTVFIGVDKQVLKEFLYYLFHFDRSNELVFNNFHTFIVNRDIFGALNFLKSVVNIEEVKRNLQNALLQYGVVSKETKDLNTIINLYVETEEPSLAQKLFRYLLYIDFESRESFNQYIEDYLGYENDIKRYMSISDYIYSSYKL